MPFIKCTMLIEARSAVSSPSVRARIGGWSESWYDNSSTLTDVVRARFVTLCTRRAALLPQGTQITGQRYQIVDPVGASSTGSRIYPGSAGTQADIPQMALLMRIPGQGVANHRPVYLRGLPDARVVEGEYSPSAVYTNALSLFLQALVGWNFRGRNLAAAAVPILTIDVNGVFQLETDSALGAGSMVRVLRTNLLAGGQFGGRFRIAAMPTARTGTLADWSAGPAVGGRLRLDSIIYPEVGPGLTVDDVISRVVTKKVGRPFSEYSGRRSS